MATDRVSCLPPEMLVQSFRRGFHPGGERESPHPMHGMWTEGEMRSGKNGEGYYDPTASIAIGRVTREERRKKKHGSKNHPGTHTGRTDLAREVHTDPVRNQFHSGVRGDGHLCTETRSRDQTAHRRRGDGAGKIDTGRQDKTGGKKKCSKSTKRTSMRTDFSRD